MKLRLTPDAKARQQHKNKEEMECQIDSETPVNMLSYKDFSQHYSREESEITTKQSQIKNYTN